MSNAVFDSLVRSIKEAGGILRGEIKDYETWVVPTSKSRSKPSTVLAVFVGKDGELVTGKIYSVTIMPSRRFLVLDETGESVLCNPNDFLIVSFQPKAEKLLKKLVTA